MGPTVQNSHNSQTKILLKFLKFFLKTGRIFESFWTGPDLAPSSGVNCSTEPGGDLLLCMIV